MLSIYNCLKSRTTYCHSSRRTKEKNDRMPQNVKILTARNNSLLSTPEPTQCTENLSLNTVLSPPLCTVKLCVCTQTKRHTHAMNKHHKPHTHTHTPVTSFQKTKKIFGSIAWDSFICDIWDKTSQRPQSFGFLSICTAFTQGASLIWKPHSERQYNYNRTQKTPL